MEVNIIAIGNSKGIRLSKTLLERYNIQDKVDLVLEKDQIIIRPVRKPRQGWAAAFKRMHANGDDKLLMPDVFPDERIDPW